jgi:hypothetical protein
VDSVGLLYVTWNYATAASQNGTCSYQCHIMVKMILIYYFHVKECKYSNSNVFVCDVLNSNYFVMKGK